MGGVQFDPYDIEKDRGPDPNVVKHRVVANLTWEVPVGKGRSHGTLFSAIKDGADPTAAEIIRFVRKTAGDSRAPAERK